MKPNILIIGEDDYSNNIPHFVVSCEYGSAVAKAGGLPLVVLDTLHPEDYIDIGDGLLLTGGPDIHCSRYGEFYRDQSEVPYLSRNREVLELQMCKLFLEAGKPVFGIGRGMQIINTVLGGTLHRDIFDKTDTAHSGERDIKTPKAKITFHQVRVNPDSKLSGVLNDRETVNSCHHQAVKDLGQNLIVSAMAEDDIIEAIEHTSLPVFGVEWHPEHSEGQLKADNRVFDYFISLCKGGAL